jgi:phospholipid/cholesterol/gamma-HCH transport system substrate-binding protein
MAGSRKPSAALNSCQLRKQSQHKQHAVSLVIAFGVSLRYAGNMTEPVSSNQTPAPKASGLEGDVAALLDHDIAEVARRNPGRFWLALAVLSAIVLMGLSAWRQGWFTPMTHVFVELPGASGVQIGTPVRLKGFKIGDVDDIELDPQLNVRARLRIASERMTLLGKDASARFGRDGPLGGKYIDVLAGGREGARLAQGAMLPMDVGNELEDVMGTVKVAVEKLAVAIGKMEPILDDTKKLTGEAAEMRKDIRASVTTVLANMEAMSGQLKAMGNSAGNVAQRLDKDSVALMQDVRKITDQAEAAALAARNSLTALEQGMPPTLDKVKEALTSVQTSAENVKIITEDVRQMVSEIKGDVPPAVRAARTAAQDAAVITEGAKKTWPISTFVKNAPSTKSTTATTVTIPNTP